MKPRLGISMGDPVGVGPEVIAKAFDLAEKEAGGFNAVVFGDVAVMERYARPHQTVVELTSLDVVPPKAPGQIPVVPVTRIKNFEPAEPNPETDQAQLDYIHSVVSAIQKQQIDALVTAPIHKEAIRRAGAVWPGHTEMLADLTSNEVDGKQKSVMMLAGPTIRTVPVTTHIAVNELSKCLDENILVYTIEVTARALQKFFGRPEPKIAVAGLNPHAGEGGLFGREEIEVIEPAIRLAERNLGFNICGPLPGDTVFLQASKGEFDAVLGMYHDQALIPVKLLDFDRAVNVTLGLPIIRTSVDHGTAYDIAGKDLASEISMVEAIKLADSMVRCAKTHA